MNVVSLREHRARLRRKAERAAHEAERLRRERERTELLHRILGDEDDGGWAA